MSNITKLHEDATIRIPAAILKKAGIKAGADIIWYYDEATRQIVMMEKPDDFAKALRGLGKELWIDGDSDSYVNEERQTWG